MIGDSSSFNLDPNVVSFSFFFFFSYPLLLIDLHNDDDLDLEIICNFLFRLETEKRETDYGFFSLIKIILSFYDRKEEKEGTKVENLEILEKNLQRETKQRCRDTRV